MSVDGIKTLVIDLIGQLSHSVFGRLSCKPAPKEVKSAYTNINDLSRLLNTALLEAISGQGEINNLGP